MQGCQHAVAFSNPANTPLHPPCPHVPYDEGSSWRRHRRRKPGLGCCALCWCRLAQEIEPGYCEPTYWVGLTSMNMGNTSAGLSILKASLSCRYSAGRVWVLWSAAVQQAQAKLQQAGVACVAVLVQKGFGMSFLHTALSVVCVCAVSCLQVHCC